MLNKLTASEIDSWAQLHPRRAQEILPELVGRLILATAKKVESFHFPIEKAIQFAGYDGVLESSEDTAFFPSGKTVWEFGTDNRAINKFQRDIAKRSDDSLGVSIQDTAFIFATLKIWNHRMSIEELVNESKRKYGWKNIRIIDASTITLWLESCTAVSIWMSEVMGKMVRGMLSVEQYWEEYCHSTNPTLVTDFFLQNREEQVKALLTWLTAENGHGYRVLTADSSLEATLFLLAAVLSLSGRDDIALNALKSKIAIVISAEMWDQVVSSRDENNRTVFIPTFNFTEDIRCPNNISAILPISKYSPTAKQIKNIEKIEIPARSKDEFGRAVETLGFPPSEAYNLCMKTKRSFLSLYRAITLRPTRKEPKWATLSDLDELLPILLLGGWNDKYSGDREIVEKISGISYGNYTKLLDVKSGAIIDYYLGKLLEYNRPFSALQIVAYTDYGNSDMLIRILDQLLILQTHKEASGASASGMHQHGIMHLFQQIYKNQNIDDLVVARIEMAYLPLFQSDAEPKCLVKYLQANPKEYAFILTKCSKPDEPSGEKPDEDAQTQAHTAYEVLNLFKSIPGCNETNISADTFLSWMNEAGEYATGLGYSKAFNHWVGRLLSYAPVGADGIFPHEIVREFIEKNDVPRIADNFIVWKQNQRGVHAITGGIEEKDISNRYYNDSQALRIAYPRTSAILERLGDAYKRESQREQKQELLDFWD